MKIQNVELLISNFEETVKFYREILLFEVLEEKENKVSFQIGESVLQFIKDEKGNHHYYHFAFNIHSNMFQKAKEWLSDRVKLLIEDGEDEIDFGGKTQANACYFENPSGNIVEFIARWKTSPNSREGDFTINNVLNISEISLSTDHIKKVADRMASLGIPVRDGGSLHLKDRLNFMGEYEDGSFILLAPIGRRWLFSTKTSVASPVIIHTDRGVVTNLIEES
ncbi:VOC family protein [Bacillus massilinigeriensis]|uniref:VOC family protein n=1 Tax=Bacillus mediterraneensis TaxID=1805474 RepID=UPI0008F87971|nr:VOC family protein [Bacillus mediterraneensis]